MTQIRLRNGKMITLNPQQDEALNRIKAWLGAKNGEGNVFVLQGYSGTGKSSIVKHAIDWYMDSRGRWDRGIAVTAPTHKAKKVIANATDLEGKTIQSLVGLAPNTEVLNFDINNPEFSLLNKPKIADFSVILIDESSMLNSDMWDLLISTATRIGVKLLFMGDAAQLPPVGEEISPMVTSMDVQHRYELTQVERQAEDNPLMLIYDAIRNNLSSLKDAFPHQSDYRINEDVGIIFTNEIMTFGKKALKAFVSQDFATDPSYCKILCWTNDKVKYWNNAIRKSLMFKRKKELDPLETVNDEFLMPGEILMGYNSFKDSITNAAEYKVLEIEYIEDELMFGDDMNDTVKITGYQVVLQNVDLDNDQVNCMIVEPNANNYQNWLYAFNYYHGLGKFKKQWNRYYSWKAGYMLISDIRDVNKKLIVKKDLDYAYALSVHKVQGSTYNRVFVDENDIDKLEDQGLVQALMVADRKKAASINKKVLAEFDKKYPNFQAYYKQKQIEKNKLKYVALSRPTDLAVVFSNKTIDNE